MGPREADYHLNINLQMNYWPAGPCNLTDTLPPLVDWLAGLTDSEPPSVIAIG